MNKNRRDSLIAMILITLAGTIFLPVILSGQAKDVLIIFEVEFNGKNIAAMEAEITDIDVC